jgi:putative FmdB family regulatory protein
MPTYEFRCELGHATDRFFGNMSSAPSEIDCPECGTRAVRQVSGGIGLHFKGSGFYITDYGKDGKKQRQTEGEGAKADAGRGDAGGGDAGGGAAGKEAPKTASAEPAKPGGRESAGGAKPVAPVKSESTTSSTKPKNE